MNIFQIFLLARRALAVRRERREAQRRAVLPKIYFSGDGNTQIIPLENGQMCVSEFEIIEGHRTPVKEDTRPSTIAFEKRLTF